MTTEHHATRTLVKSPPELWAECSEAATLARHLNGSFGEIRITRLEPETKVAWEGEQTSGTVEIEPSGWGTRVTLTAQTTVEPEVEPAAASEPTVSPVTNHDPVEEEVDAKVEETLAQPDPALAAGPAPVRRRWKTLIGRTRSLFRAPDEATATLSPSDEASAAGPPPEEPTAVAPEPPAAPPEPDLVPPAPPEAQADPRFDPEAILAAALESLGQAHHRPFSRA